MDRTFNGKLYKYYRWSPSKKDAKDVANRLRNKGNLARVTKVITNNPADKGYIIWTWNSKGIYPRY